MFYLPPIFPFSPFPRLLAISALHLPHPTPFSSPLFLLTSYTTFIHAPTNTPPPTQLAKRTIRQRARDGRSGPEKAAGGGYDGTGRWGGYGETGKGVVGGEGEVETWVSGFCIFFFFVVGCGFWKKRRGMGEKEMERRRGISDERLGLMNDLGGRITGLVGLVVGRRRGRSRSRCIRGGVDWV